MRAPDTWAAPLFATIAASESAEVERDAMLVVAACAAAAIAAWVTAGRRVLADAAHGAPVALAGMAQAAMMGTVFPNLGVLSGATMREVADAVLDMWLPVMTKVTWNNDPLCMIISLTILIGFSTYVSGVALRVL